MEALETEDFHFVNELVNTEGWLKFIGDRNVHSDEDAKAYILKTLENENIHYWVVKLKGDLTPIGIVSFVKRDFLPGRDLGFAFLPRYWGQGYAFEAVKAALEMFNSNYDDKTVLAISNKDNLPSIKLLEKFGFTHQKEMDNKGKLVQVYELLLYQFPLYRDTDQIGKVFGSGF